MLGRFSLSGILLNNKDFKQLLINSVRLKKLIIFVQTGDMRELGITESFAVKHAVVNSAAEAAEMILRVDDILKATPR